MTRSLTTPPTRSHDEAAFLATYDARQFQRPSVAVDVVLLTIAQRTLRTLVVCRSEHPHKGLWSLPGTFMGMDEHLKDAARRVIESKAGLRNIFVEQLYTFDAPARDPRTRVLSVAHMALVPSKVFARATPQQASGPQLLEVRTAWKGERGGPALILDESGEKTPLAFDHADIVGMAVKRLRGRLDYSPVGYELLPKEFTLRDLQDIHETILDRSVNKDAFRRRMLASGELEPTGRFEDSVGHRPAELYRHVRPSRAV